MTLIITALCKDGITICSDKRSRIKHSNGAVKYLDDQDKVYKFSDLPVAIFNHGINEFKGKPWYQLCKEYEQSGGWRELSFQELVGEFKTFIEPVILDELKNNKLDHATGFVLCGRTAHEPCFHVCELFWSPNFEQNNHAGFIKTGDGRIYLDSIVKIKPALDSISYWQRKSVKEAQKELEELFVAAAEVQKKAKGEYFSDTHDIVTIA